MSLSDATRVVDQMQQRLNMPPTVRGFFAGTAAAYQTSLASEPLLIGTALLAVYIVLGILYESLVHPLTIISTLPSASVGAMLALMLFKIDLNVISIIGIILLIGIVKKNAIMMIDFALVAEREHGKTTTDAIFEACMLRFRPILMTTMAALFGALAAGLRHRHRLGTPAAAGHHHRRRTDREPDADSLHHARRLSVLRSHAPPLPGQTASDSVPRNRGGALSGRSHGVLDMKSRSTQFRQACLQPSVRSMPLCSARCWPAATWGRSIFPLQSLRLRPSRNLPTQFKEADEWTVAQPQDAALRGKWWEIYNEPELNALEDNSTSTTRIFSRPSRTSWKRAPWCVRRARSIFPR